MKKYHYPQEGYEREGGNLQPNIETVINSNVLSVPRLTNADLADSSEAEEYKSFHAELIKSDNAQLMLAVLTAL